MRISTGGSKQLEFFCQICKKVFGHHKTLKNHIQLFHNEDNKSNMQCTFCDHKSGTRQNLEKHISVVHEKIKPYACPHCDRKFGEKRYMKGHIFNIHEKVKTDKPKFMSPSEVLKFLNSYSLHFSHRFLFFLF